MNRRRTLPPVYARTEDVAKINAARARQEVHNDLRRKRGCLFGLVDGAGKVFLTIALVGGAIIAILIYNQETPTAAAIPDQVKSQAGQVLATNTPRPSATQEPQPTPWPTAAISVKTEIEYVYIEIPGPVDYVEVTRVVVQSATPEPVPTKSLYQLSMEQQLQQDAADRTLTRAWMWLGYSVAVLSVLLLVVAVIVGMVRHWTTPQVEDIGEDQERGAAPMSDDDAKLYGDIRQLLKASIAASHASGHTLVGWRAMPSWGAERWTAAVDELESCDVKLIRNEREPVRLVGVSLGDLLEAMPTPPPY